MNGYIKLYRQIADSEEYSLSKFDATHAWIDLLMIANLKESYIMVRGIKVLVRRGQLARSQEYLADRWHWSRNTVIKQLKTWEAEGQIVVLRNINEQQTEQENKQILSAKKTCLNRVIQIITIVNYDKYQGDYDATKIDDLEQQVKKLLENEQQIKQQIEQLNKKNKELREKINKENINTKESFEKRKDAFADTIRPFIKTDDGRGLYPKDMCNDFFSYWTEPNKSGTKMRFELERTWSITRRLDTWAKRY